MITEIYNGDIRVIFHSKEEEDVFVEFINQYVKEVQCETTDNYDRAMKVLDK